MEVSKSISSVMSVILNPPVYYFIIALIIIKILLLKYIPTNVLNIYNNIVFRGAFALFVAIIASYDFILATILISCFLLAVQEYNNRIDSGMVADAGGVGADIPSQLVSSLLNIMGTPPPQALQNILQSQLPQALQNIPQSQLTQALQNIPQSQLPQALQNIPQSQLTQALQNIPQSQLTQALQNIPQSQLALQTKVSNLKNNPNIADGVNYTLRQVQAVDLVNQVNTAVDQSRAVPAINTIANIANAGAVPPAFTTLTDNLMAKGFENLSLEQLKLAGSNVVAGVDPDNALESTGNSLNVQGLFMKFPTGYDVASVQSSKF